MVCHQTVGKNRCPALFSVLYNQIKIGFKINIIQKNILSIVSPLDDMMRISITILTIRGITKRCQDGTRLSIIGMCPEWHYKID